jgi:hypothetical protein
LLAYLHKKYGLIMTHTYGPKIKKSSKWTFNTSATGGIGLGCFAGSGGLIQLQTPDKQRLVSYHYAGAGVGFSRGGRLSKLGKIPPIDLKGRSGTGSTTDFPSYGTIYMMEACDKEELAEDDFKGACTFIDGGAGLIIAGWSGTALLVGIPPLLLSAGVAVPMSMPIAMGSAKALILMTGLNAGAQLPGGGISINLGYLR